MVGAHIALLLMVQKSCEKTTWHVWNPANNGTKSPYQLVGYQWNLPFRVQSPPVIWAQKLHVHAASHGMFHWPQDRIPMEWLSCMIFMYVGKCTNTYQHPPRGGVWTLRGCLMAPFTIHLAPLGGPRYIHFDFLEEVLWFFSRFQQINLTEIPKRSRFFVSILAELWSNFAHFTIFKIFKMVVFSTAMLVFWRVWIYSFKFCGTKDRSRALILGDPHNHRFRVSQVEEKPCGLQKCFSPIHQQKNGTESQRTTFRKLLELLDSQV